MGDLAHVPEPMPADQLADILERLAVSVRSGDSLEGFLEYTLPTEDDPAPADGDWRMVRARLRQGNLMGQGGMTMIGRFQTVESRREPDLTAGPEVPLGDG